MVSYLVMKNNIKRLMRIKSTYLIMVLIPLLLVLIGTVSVRIENKQLRVGILGSETYIQAMSEKLEGLDGILFELAGEDTINTDKLMGKYHIILSEKEDKDSLQDIQEFMEGRLGQAVVISSAGQRMVFMLLPIYMTIATLYGMKYLRDKRDGAVERVLVSGGAKYSYLTGCFCSSMIITGIQLAVILFSWKLLDSNFTYSAIETGILFLFILLISNLYGIVVVRISKSEMMAGILGSSGAALCSLLGIL